MNMDKIIGAMRVKRNNKIIEAQDFSRGGYSKREMLALADGYSMAVKDLSDLITQQTPPCTGSSVQKVLLEKELSSTIANVVKEAIESVKEYDKAMYKLSRVSEQEKDKIEKLEPSITKEPVPATVTSFDKSGNVTFEFKRVDTYKNEPPTNEQLMDKINEIIDVINKER
jgi:hypothetical protein